MPTAQRLAAQIILWLLLGSLLAACAAPATQPGSLPPITSSGGQLRIGWRTFEVRGVNYIHTLNADTSRCPQIQFGADGNCPWDDTEIQRDLDRLQLLGINTIRVFLNYYVFGGASKTNPSYEMSQALAHLDYLIAEANLRGIYVLPVLLQKYPQDRFGAEHYETALRVHVRPVVQHLAGRPGILGWDLFNEPDIGSPVTIRCWDWDNADDPTCLPLAIERLQFLRTIAAEVKQLDPARLTTIGVAFAKSHHEPVEASIRLADLVDFFSFHYYDDEPQQSGKYRQHWYYGQGFPDDLRRSINEIQALGLNRPIVVSEIGFPAGPGHNRTYPAMLRDQQQALAMAREEAISGLVIWLFTAEPEREIAGLYR